MRNKIQFLQIFHINVLILLFFMFITFGLALSTITPFSKYHKDNACPENMFLCNSSQRCIPRSWICDQERDCLDGEDEKDCDNKQFQCAKDEYPCRVTTNGIRTEHTNPWLTHLNGIGSFFSHTCIPSMWKCDGEVDCLEKDDEENCQEIKCDEKHFECKSFDSSATSCIPVEWICDGQIDCLDMKDEKNCTLRENKCDPILEFRCNDGQCIYANWTCDGDHDCTDGSDENNCHESCDANKFKCTTGNICIPSLWKCDGELDCPDHSDEMGCQSSELHQIHSVNCSSTEFQCKNHAQCISKFWVCDGDEDCFDGSDEINCARDQCSAGSKACRDGRCIAEAFWCDGAKDCADGYDEQNCTSAIVLPKMETCDIKTEYTCPDETPLRCIKYEHLCDGIPANDCTKSICRTEILNCTEKGNTGCKCRGMGPNKDQGKLCHCEIGFEMHGTQCQDIDECLQQGVCTQKCINLPGTYRCECYPGYTLTVSEMGKEGNVPHKCRAVGSDPILLLANRATIRQFDIVKNKYHPLINQLESAVALDYWHERQTLVWSDVSKEQIMICSNITGLINGTMLESIDQNCTDDKHNLIKISENVTTPDGLALDWVHGLLFWTDTGTDTISVYDFNTKKRTVLIEKELDEPRAIVVDPTAGLIFWTDWGQKARIERAGMDGKDRKIIIEGNTIRWPNGLAVDILDKRLYWADAKTKQISSSDYWGQNIRTVLHSHQHLRHPFSLAVFEERLYWTDWDQECVLSVNKFNGGDVSKMMNGIAGPMTVRVYHQQAQPKHENKCKNHNCNHICLPRALYKSGTESEEVPFLDLPYTCACENGFRIDVKNSSLCIPLIPFDALSAAVIESIEHINENKINPFTYIFGLFVVCIVFVMIYIYQHKKPRHFAAIHFDNPIYRRTVEADLDADLENLQDNSLGPISILPIGENRSRSLNGQSSATTLPSQSTKLVLAVPVHKKDEISSSTIMVDTNNPQEYGYDQPLTPKL